MDNPNVRILEKKHICSFCDFKTHKKYNLDLHMKNKHGNNKNGVRMNHAPTTVSVGYNTARNPTHQPGSGIHRNEATLHCESGPAEIYQPNTVSMEDYTKATESAHGWKNAYGGLVYLLVQILIKK